MNPGREKVEAEGKCRVCETDKWLEAAHLIDKSIKGTDYSEALIIVPLCRACHHLYDMHKLDILPYLTVPEQAAAVGLIGLARAYKRLTGDNPQR